MEFLCPKEEYWEEEPAATWPRPILRIGAEVVLCLRSDWFLAEARFVKTAALLVVKGDD
jgi:hypothetical protein